jgi:hypothetical protein
MNASMCSDERDGTPSFFYATASPRLRLCGAPNRDTTIILRAVAVPFYRADQPDEKTSLCIMRQHITVS